MNGNIEGNMFLNNSTYFKNELDLCKSFILFAHFEGKSTLFIF